MGASGIAGVADADILKHVLELERRIEPRQLQPAPAGADLRRRRDEEFYRGVGRDDRADVAAVEHGARSLMGEGDLVGFERRAHFRDGGGLAGALAGFAAPEGVVGQQGGGDQRPGLRRRNASHMRQMADGAVQQAGIEKRQAVIGGDYAGQSALSGSGRPIEGDKEGRSGHLDACKAET